MSKVIIQVIACVFIIFFIIGKLAATAPVVAVQQNVIKPSQSFAKNYRSIYKEFEIQLAEINKQQEQNTNNLELQARKLELQAKKIELLLQKQKDISDKLQRKLQLASNNATADASNGLIVHSIEGRAYYNALILAIENKQYLQAVEAFQLFIKNYPSSAFIDKAHYWLGQIYFYQNNIKGAVRELNLVVTNYKDSSKRAESLFKLGVIALTLNAKDISTDYFNQVINEYPNTTEARLAKQQQQLKKLSANK